jgi:hypothetical protein
MLKECEGCIQDPPCIVQHYKREEDCPCKECLVKTMCENNVCQVFETTMARFHSTSVYVYDRSLEGRWKSIK